MLAPAAAIGEANETLNFIARRREHADAGNTDVRAIPDRMITGDERLSIGDDPRHCQATEVEDHLARTSAA